MNKIILLKDRSDYCQYPMVSFVNLYSLSIVMNLSRENENIVYFSDGWLLSKIVSIFSKKNIERVSFDDTSLAPIIFENLISQGKNVFFLGSKKHEIKEFTDKKKKQYPQLDIAGISDGYITDVEKKYIFNEIVDLGVDIVVMGLGAGMQEKSMQQLYDCGFKGKIYSCGGYFHQTALSRSNYYYPDWVNKFHLRALYRCFKEPSTIKRYLINYPINFLVLYKALKNENIQIQ